MTTWTLSISSVHPSELKSYGLHRSYSFSKHCILCTPDMCAANSIVQTINENTESAVSSTMYGKMYWAWNVLVSDSSLLQLTGQVWCGYSTDRAWLEQTIQFWGGLSLFSSSADEGPHKAQSQNDNGLKHQWLFHRTRRLIFALVPMSICFWM